MKEQLVQPGAFFKKTIAGNTSDWKFATRMMKLFGHDPFDGEMAAQVVALLHEHNKEAS